MMIILWSDDCRCYKPQGLTPPALPTPLSLAPQHISVFNDSAHLVDLARSPAARRTGCHCHLWPQGRKGSFRFLKGQLHRTLFVAHAVAGYTPTPGEEVVTCGGREHSCAVERHWENRRGCGACIFRAWVTLGMHRVDTPPLQIPPSSPVMPVSTG